MKVFAETTAPPKPASVAVRNIAWVYAAILVIMAVGQLFGFEKFIPLIESFGITGGYGGATLLATLIVITEVFAIPFLIRMYISPLMRVVSMAAGVLAALLWVYVTIAVSIGQNAVTNIGFFGTKVHFPAGIFAVIAALLLLALAIFAVRGLRGSRSAHTK